MSMMLSLDMAANGCSTPILIFHKRRLTNIQELFRYIIQFRIRDSGHILFIVKVDENVLTFFPFNKI